MSEQEINCNNDTEDVFYDTDYYVDLFANKDKLISDVVEYEYPDIDITYDDTESNYSCSYDDSTDSINDDISNEDMDSIDDIDDSNDSNDMIESTLACSAANILLEPHFFVANKSENCYSNNNDYVIKSTEGDIDEFYFKNTTFLLDYYNLSRDTNFSHSMLKQNARKIAMEKWKKNIPNNIKIEIVN